MTCKIMKLAATLLLATAATSAGASELTVVGPLPDDEARRTAITHSDLNLADATGQRALKARIASAASSVCADHRGAGASTRYGQCLSVAWTGARPQVDRAIERANQLAATGSTSIAPVAITVSAIGR